MKDILKGVLFIILMVFVLAFLTTLNEEKPHEIIINGKKYIRAKEYTGNGTYQVILISIDSVSSK